MPLDTFAPREAPDAIRLHEEYWGGLVVGATAEQLLERHADINWRTRFVDINDLIEILRDCIIADGYTIPDDLNEAIALTARGNALKSRLIRKEEVPAKEAHLMCALTVGHDDLFIDVLNTDIAALRDSIGRQIREGAVRFPFVYGRALYDAFADEFEDEKDYLSSEETVKLLGKIPFGVFQYGRYVVGPSGISESKHSRALRFSKRVPAFHCSDPVCRDLHSVILSTGHNADINAQRHKLTRVLEGESKPAADWAGLAMEISRLSDSHFGNHWIAPMVTLLGDALSDDELRAVLALLSGVEVTAERPNLLERALQWSDKKLAGTVDRMVLGGDICVPLGEVRTPVSTDHMRSGAFRLQPQLGSRGVRFVSGDPGLATLRERELVRTLYLTGNDDERHELDWQLRSVDGVSLDVRLDDYLRTTTPTEALTRLVLSRSSSAIAASEVAGLGEVDGVGDGDLIARLAWKLGFEGGSADDSHADFWTQQEKLSAIVQSWLGSGPGDTNEFRGQAATYFSALEGILEESLAFASWALLRDHITAGRPFSYDNEADRKHGLDLLQAAYTEYVTKRPGEKLKFDGRLTIYPLVRGFGVLADGLNSLIAKASSLARPLSDHPEYATRSALQRFPFASTAPFLDLAAHSRTRIVEGLRDIELTLNAETLSSVRNDYSHYRRTSPELAAMERTLESVGRAVRAIENLGFGLNLCHPSTETSDQWGRRTIGFVGPRSLNHVFARPSSLEWVGFPSLRRPQYLVRSAAFDDANEVLRFERQYDSEYARMWDDYPRPRKKAQPTIDSLAEDAPAGAS
ncbi:hypothetical protein [Microbacterium telephonicum]|uniref:hypothetical protein n=1 Tax=Microbacterium telephonicum TaxID=1714841 RepID=UPI0011C47E72|nr:hypothetical protein [Microbacterium telephonicum]